MLPRSERTRFQQQQEENLNGGPIHIDAKPSPYKDISLDGKILDYQVRDSMKLPAHANVKYFDTNSQELSDEAYRFDYNKHNAVAANLKLAIKWWDLFGFDDPEGTQHHVMLHRGDFIKYRNGEIGHIDQIFTRQSMANGQPRLFMRISPAVSTDYKDPVVDLDTYKLEEQQSECSQESCLHPGQSSA